LLIKFTNVRRSLVKRLSPVVRRSQVGSSSSQSSGKVLVLVTRVIERVVGRYRRLPLTFNSGSEHRCPRLSLATSSSFLGVTRPDLLLVCFGLLEYSLLVYLMLSLRCIALACHRLIRPGFRSITSIEIFRRRGDAIRIRRLGDQLSGGIGSLLFH